MMSMFDNLTPKHALESLGLRQQEPHVLTELVLPILAAFGVGVGVGAGVALLLAPQSGRELRNDLGRRAGKLEGSIRKALPTRRADTTNDLSLEDDHSLSSSS